MLQRASYHTLDLRGFAYGLLAVAYPGGNVSDTFRAPAEPTPLDWAANAVAQRYGRSWEDSRIIVTVMLEKVRASEPLSGIEEFAYAAFQKAQREMDSQESR